jgi:hypothetical protein
MFLDNELSGKADETTRIVRVLEMLQLFAKLVRTPAIVTVQKGNVAATRLDYSGISGRRAPQVPSESEKTHRKVGPKSVYMCN